MATITAYFTAISAWFKSLEIIATVTGWSKSWLNTIGGVLALVVILYYGAPYAVKAFNATAAYVQSPSDKYISAKQFDEWTSSNAVLMRAGVGTLQELNREVVGLKKEVAELKALLRQHDARFPSPKKQPATTWFGLTQ